MSPLGLAEVAPRGGIMDTTQLCVPDPSHTHRDQVALSHRAPLPRPCCHCCHCSWLLPGPCKAVGLILPPSIVPDVFQVLCVFLLRVQPGTRVHQAPALEMVRNGLCLLWDVPRWLWNTLQVFKSRLDRAWSNLV